MAAASSMKHDVFLSFRGADIRDGFMSHLRGALERFKIDVFVDQNLRRGKEITTSLMKAIQESYVSVVIFSENYAQSTWTLDELVKIHECMRRRNQIVIPVFYKVDPTDVQELRGNYATTNPIYRQALVDISNLSGFYSDNPLFKPELKLVDEISKEVSTILCELHPSLPNNYGLFGVDSSIKEVEKLLCVESSDVRMVGIWGLGGIGKTTLANAVFNKVKANFDSSCFVSNVSQTLSNKTGVDDLRNKIIRQLLYGVRKVDSAHASADFIKKRLRRTKCLVVLDDVGDCMELKALLEDDLHLSGSFCPGSRIIVTSRDKRVTETVNMDAYTYKLEPLHRDQASQLFCWHAFQQSKPPEEFEEVTEQVLQYCNGVPLALTLLGPELRHKQVEYWEDQMDKLKGTPHRRIQRVLQLSYDGLDSNEREIFLDIACFYDGDFREDVDRKLEACGFHSRIGIDRLIDKSLISVTYGRIKMHDLVQQMGQEIVIQEQRRNRLWTCDDFADALRDVKATENVHGILLKQEDIDAAASCLDLSSKAFINMSKLRLLEVRGKVQLPEGLEFLPNSLRYLHWDYYPLDYLPDNFYPWKLVELDLSRSQLKRLVLNKPLKNLKRIILRFCSDLISISDLAYAPKLEIIDLTGCSNLVEFGTSLENLTELTGLYLRWCSSLKKLPDIPCSIKDLDLSYSGICQLPSTIGRLAHLKHLSLESCTSLLSLPSSLGHMENLECLNLRHCSNLESLPNTLSNLGNLQNLDLSHCKNLNRLLENLGKLESLKELDVSESGIKALPSSIQCLKQLERLNCCGCKGLKLPPWTGLPRLEHINLNHCHLLDFPEQACSIKSLQVLNLKGNHFTSVATSIKNLSNLRRLDLTNCEYLVSFPDLPSDLEVLYARNCKSLEKVPVPFIFPQVFVDLSNCFRLKHMAPSITDQYLLEMDVSAFQVPELSLIGNEVLKWMKYRNNNGPSLSLELESFRQTINIVFCVVIASKASPSRFRRAQVQCLLTDDKGIVTCYPTHGFLEASNEESSSNMILWSGNIQCRKHVKNASFICKWFGDDEDGHVSRCEANHKIIKCGIHPLIGEENQGSSRLHLLSRI